MKRTNSHTRPAGLGAHLRQISPTRIGGRSSERSGRKGASEDTVLGFEPPQTNKQARPPGGLGAKLP